ncbi:hypothetical protein Tco_0444958 [Tanacetum coccineum]
MCHLTQLSVKCFYSYANQRTPTKNWGTDIPNSPKLDVFQVAGQFCDSDLEVAFRKHTCFVRDLNGTDILKGSRGTNLYTISIDEMMKSSPICLLSKASKSKSWLWHRRLNH